MTRKKAKCAVVVKARGHTECAGKKDFKSVPLFG